MTNTHVKHITAKTISSELEKIANVLHSQGFKTVFGYKDGQTRTVFYNDSEDNPTHSLSFIQEPPSPEWMLVGGFIAHPFIDSKDELVANHNDSEHLLGGEIYWYDFESPNVDIYLGFAKGHINDDCFLNEFVTGGFASPLVHKGMSQEHDILE